MKNLSRMFFVLSLCFFNTSVVWGAKETIEFTGDLAAFTSKVSKLHHDIQEAQNKGESDYSINLTIKPSQIVQDVKPLFDEITKLQDYIETLTITSSPGCVINDLLSTIEEYDNEHGRFKQLKTLDLSGNKNPCDTPLFFGLDSVLDKVPSIDALILSNNDLSEDMDFVLQGIITKNQLKTLDLSNTNPTTQTMSCVINALMSQQSTLPLNLLLNSNVLKEEHASLILSLLETTNEQSRCLENLCLKDCQMPSKDLTSIVNAYLIQGSCASLFCEDKQRSNISLETIGEFFTELKKYEIPLLGPLERLKVLSENNPPFKASLKGGHSFLQKIDENLDHLLLSDASNVGKKIDNRPQEITALQEYFTNLWA